MSTHKLSVEEEQYILKLVQADMDKANCDFGCKQCSIAESVASKLCYEVRDGK